MKTKLLAMLLGYLPVTDCPSVVIKTPPPYCTADSLRAVAYVNGGAWPYTFLWGNGSADSVIAVMDSGSYKLTVVVTDAHGCAVKDSLIVLK